MTTTATTSHSRTQSVEEETAAHYCYSTMMMDSARPASSSVDEMMTTVLLFDGALGDMVAVSTPRTAADGEEGVWQTVRRVESHPQDDLNLWWSVDAGYLLDDDVKKKAAVSVEEDKEEEVEVSRRLLVAPPPAPSSPAVTIGVEEEEEEAIIISAGGAEEEEAVAPAAAKRIRLFAYCSAAPQQKNWAGAVPAKKARRAPKRYARTWRARIRYGGREARGAVPPDRGGARAALRARGVGARD
jgi:hypothetical protein